MIFEYSGIEELEKFLKQRDRDRLLALPTESSYALSALVSSAHALNRVFEIKQRPKTQALTLFVAQWEFAFEYIDFKGDDFLNLLPQLIYAPLTVVFPSRHELSSILGNQSPSIAIRSCRSELLSAISNYYSSPLTATSLNITGKPSVYNISEINQYFREISDLDIIHAPSLPPIFKMPSTIIMPQARKIKILRQGSYPAAKLQADLGVGWKIELTHP